MNSNGVAGDSRSTFFSLVLRKGGLALGGQFGKSVRFDCPAVFLCVSRFDGGSLVISSRTCIGCAGMFPPTAGLREHRLMLHNQTPDSSSAANHIEMLTNPILFH